MEQRISIENKFFKIIFRKHRSSLRFVSQNCYLNFKTCLYIDSHNPRVCVCMKTLRFLIAPMTIVFGSIVK